MNSSDASFRLLACGYLQKQTKTLLAHIDGIRTGEDIESIHQARVASRRIGTALGVFATVFPAKKVRRWSKHIRRLIKGLGAARDKDVQIEFVVRMVEDRTPAKGVDLPGLKRLLLRLRQQRKAIQPHVIKTLDKLDGTDILSEMLTRTTKSTSRLQKAGADLGSPFVLERGERDILKACNRLLELQSCLEDIEAVEQHHQMRIAAKTLRYTMETYKKVFHKRLNETIKVVRRIQTLLGDIHDCDMWCEFIQTFTQEEQQRTVEYYGHARSFRRLRPGFEYLRNERIAHRRETFNELVSLWKELQKDRFWEELIVNLKAPQAESCSRTPDHMIVQTGEPASETEDTPISQNLEESGRIRTKSSQTESSEILDEGENGTSWPVLEQDQEDVQTYTSTKEESEAQIDEAIPSSTAETNRVFETSPDKESSLPDHTAPNSFTPDHPVVSRDSLTENALCECCGQNSFLQNELCRIDSGQLLCPGCLGEFHGKAGHSAK